MCEDHKSQFRKKATQSLAQPQTNEFRACEELNSNKSIKTYMLLLSLFAYQTVMSSSNPVWSYPWTAIRTLWPLKDVRIRPFMRIYVHFRFSLKLRKYNLTWNQFDPSWMIPALASRRPTSTNYIQEPPPINSPLAETETQEAAPSRNTTRVNIVVPLSAATRSRTDTREGGEEPAAGAALWDQREKANQGQAAPNVFYRRGGQTPNSTLKY